MDFFIVYKGFLNRKTIINNSFKIIKAGLLINKNFKEKFYINNIIRFIYIYIYSIIINIKYTYLLFTYSIVILHSYSILHLKYIFFNK